MSDNFKANEMINEFFADRHCHYWEHNTTGIFRFRLYFNMNAKQYICLRMLTFDLCQS